MATEQQTELYRLDDPKGLLSPSLVFFREIIERNVNAMVQMAGSASRLRPHVKTHKTREIVKMQIEKGITKHKCATIAEAEMLGQLNVDSVLIAYQMVGPNVRRLLRLLDTFPGTKFAVLVDNPFSLKQLSSVMEDHSQSVEVMMDLDPGMHRTGIPVGPEAIELYEMIASSPGITAAGLHWYDGHHRQPDLTERTAMVMEGWNRFTRFRDQLLLSGLPIPRIVAAGTGSFPILAEVGEPNLELSAGTTVLHDADMAERFPELPFQPAAGILTRVVSNRRAGFLTVDVGHKSCAADQPAGHRLWFPALPDAKEVKQNEEHLVIQSSAAGQFSIGDPLIAIPRHICPTVAVYERATVVENRRQVDHWMIAGRVRKITI